MTWGIQVLVDDEWKWVHPTGSKRYEYSTENKAWNMLNICYPDQIIEQKLGSKETVRVKEIKD
jgi:hypothetical protein